MYARSVRCFVRCKRKDNMMSNEQNELPEITRIYPTLPSILRKYERYGRQDAFRGSTQAEFEAWRKKSRATLWKLLGLDKMDTCALEPEIDEVVRLSTQEGGREMKTARGKAEKKGPDSTILRYHILIHTEPDITLSAYLLVPASANADTPVILCPPGHNGDGKFTVAGVRGYRAIEESIEKYNYDFGWQLACLGYVTFCPDVRGFGERRELLEDTETLPLAMKGDCYWLAHMGEPIGIPVLGMLSWDLMRCVDFLQEYVGAEEWKEQWNPNRILAFGFSGGAMQSLYLSALDERIHASFLSGYMYGFRDSLLRMNRNCSCNYVPHLMEHFDMGDLASLIAPRRLMIQSCRADRLAGERGLQNVQEQVDMVRANYGVMGKAENVQQDIEEGPHHLDTSHLKEIVEWMVEENRI